jgi:hypothetical protein
MDVAKALRLINGKLAVLANVPLRMDRREIALVRPRDESLAIL